MVAMDHSNGINNWNPAELLEQHARDQLRHMTQTKDHTSPQHYSRLDPQPWDVITAWGLDYLRGSAIKYIARAGHKLEAPDPDDDGRSYATEKLEARLRDIEKAIAFLQKDAAETKRQILKHHEAL